jgi:hypothetical protein
VPAVAVRAVSLFGPGELRALRVSDAGVFRIIVERLQPSGPTCSGASTMSQALDSLCAVELTPLRMFVDNDEDHAAAIIERCAATIS